MLWVLSTAFKACWKFQLLLQFVKRNNNHIYSNAVYSGSLHFAEINNRISYYVMLLECISSRLYKSALLETCMVLQLRDESIAGLRCWLESCTCFGTINLIVAGILQTAKLTQTELWSDLIYIHLVVNGKVQADIFLTLYRVICTGLFLACSVETSTHTDNLPAGSSGNVDSVLVRTGFPIMLPQCCLNVVSDKNGNIKKKLKSWQWFEAIKKHFNSSLAANETHSQWLLMTFPSLTNGKEGYFFLLRLVWWVFSPLRKIPFNFFFFLSGHLG